MNIITTTTTTSSCRRPAAEVPAARARVLRRAALCDADGELLYVCIYVCTYIYMYIYI